MARSPAQPRPPIVLTRFAERLRDQIGAERVLLFGSHARGHAQSDSDYDVIVVSPRFDGLRRRERGICLRDLFYEVGGHAPMDLICLTPEEFDEASRRITLVAAVLPEAIDLLRDADARTQPAYNR
jgi:predicted nucleotidyltransferase